MLRASWYCTLTPWPPMALPAGGERAHRQAGAVPGSRAGGAEDVGLADLRARERDDLGRGGGVRRQVGVRLLVRRVRGRLLLLLRLGDQERAAFGRLLRVRRRASLASCSSPERRSAACCACSRRSSAVCWSRFASDARHARVLRELGHAAQVVQHLGGAVAGHAAPRWSDRPSRRCGRACAATSAARARERCATSVARVGRGVELLRTRRRASAVRVLRLEVGLVRLRRGAAGGDSASAAQDRGCSDVSSEPDSALMSVQADGCGGLPRSVRSP